MSIEVHEICSKNIILYVIINSPLQSEKKHPKPFGFNGIKYYF